MRALAFIVVLALCSLTGIGCVPIVPSVHGFGIEDADRRCETNDDCVIIDADCCPCSASGSRTAVARSAVEDIEARRTECPDVCSLARGDTATCCADATICVAQRCELLERAFECLF